jgi:hypothetical protein
MVGFTPHWSKQNYDAVCVKEVLARFELCMYVISPFHIFVLMNFLELTMENTL